MKSFKEDQLFITSWDRMTAKALFQVMRAEELLKEKEEQKQIARLQALCLKPKIFLKLTSFQLHDLISITKFLDKPATRFFIKTFRIGSVTYHAPADFLANFRMMELVKADFYLHEYIRTENEIYLNKLIAVLYRPARASWDDIKHLDEVRQDIRRPFFSDLVDGDALIISHLEQDIKFSILFTYLGCFKSIVKANKALFPEQASASEGSKSNTNRSKMWIYILFDLGETTFYAGERAAKQAYIHEALPYLNKKAEEATKK